MLTEERVNQLGLVCREVVDDDVNFLAARLMGHDSRNGPSCSNTGSVPPSRVSSRTIFSRENAARLTVGQTVRGAPRPASTRATGMRRPCRCRRSASSNARIAPMLKPNSTKGRSVSSRRPSSIASSSEGNSVNGASDRRRPRPGNCTAGNSSQLSDWHSFSQGSKKRALPPAWWKAISRRRASCAPVWSPTHGERTGHALTTGAGAGLVADVGAGLVNASRYDISDPPSLPWPLPTGGRRPRAVASGICPGQRRRPTDADQVQRPKLQPLHRRRAVQQPQAELRAKLDAERVERKPQTHADGL